MEWVGNHANIIYGGPGPPGQPAGPISVFQNVQVNSMALKGETGETIQSYKEIFMCN